MNKKIKLSTADILVIILYILGTGVLLKLFYNDLNQTLKKNAPPVAIVTFKEKTIQRHFSDRILWDRLQNKSDVYNGDVIRTSDASNVSVLFNDKNSFDLDENTMAQIFTGKNNTQINLSHGRVVLNASDEGAHLTVVSGNSKVTIEPGSVVEAENSGGNDDITVLVIEGEAALETGAGQTVALKGGDTFNAGHFIAPISPSPSEHFVQTQQEKMFEFLWKTPADYDMNKNTTLRFEVSTDKNFKKIIDYADLNVFETKYQTMLGAGSFWWRVYSLNMSGKSELKDAFSSNHFFVEYIPTTPSKSIDDDEFLSGTNGTISLVYPPDGAVFSKTQIIEHPLDLRWIITDRIVKTRLILSQDPNPLNAAAEGKTILNTKNQGAQRMSVLNLETGVYYWTVQAENVDGVAISAEKPASFTIVQADPLPAPSALRPAGNYIVNADRIRNNRSITLQWNAVKGANAYITTVYKGRTVRGAPIFSSGQITKTTLYIPDITVFGVGDFVWRVEALNVDASRAIIQNGTPSIGRWNINLPRLTSPEVYDTGELYGK